MKNVKIEGLNEILNSLTEVEADIKRAKNRANRRGGDIVEQELKRQVPVGTHSYYKYDGDGHMKKNTATSYNRTDRDSGETFVAVGFSKESAWRVHFPLFGTIKQPPNDFYGRTMDSSASAVQSAMADEIGKVIR